VKEVEALAAEIEVSLVVVSGVYPILVCSVEATGLAEGVPPAASMNVVCSVEATGLAEGVPSAAPMNVVCRALVVCGGAAEGDAVAILESRMGA